MITYQYSTVRILAWTTLKQTTVVLFILQRNSKKTWNLLVRGELSQAFSQILLFSHFKQQYMHWPMTPVTKTKTSGSNWDQRLKIQRTDKENERGRKKRKIGNENVDGRESLVKITCGYTEKGEYKIAGLAVMSDRFTGVIRHTVQLCLKRLLCCLATKCLAKLWCLILYTSSDIY